jgi:hypothetical protein
MSDNIYSADELQKAIENNQVQPNLPPPGDERREVLAERQDNLEQQVEAASENRGTIPPHMLEPDHNVQSALETDFLSIGINHPLYKTKWVNYVNVGGKMVWTAKAEGWKVATIDIFPDGAHCRKEDGTIREVDVILMYMRHDHYLKMLRANEEKQRRRQFGIEAEMRDIAGRHPEAFTIHDGLPSQMETRMQSAANIRRTGAMKTVANHMVNKSRS